MALLFLLARRLYDAQVRYISLPADYFALFLLLGVVVSGIFMRYVTKVDLVGGQGAVASAWSRCSPVVPGRASGCRSSSTCSSSACCSPTSRSAS